MPGWTTAAVTAQVRVVWSAMIATRVAVAPNGGPSCTLTADSTPGRSTWSRSVVVPAAAREVNRVHPASPPIANAVVEASQFTAERPRTGVTVTATTTAHIPARASAGPQAALFTANNTGAAATAMTAACHPDSPKKCPMRALE